ncbi:MAG: tRNA preQ1(34) S-adenosylmethionine ribosyltransferase-isomerase QueA [Candidatus Aerophobetes bacterium]|nr:tRNA preQ1(34) S-adenosylmethionine ribosyltransferase-isomerase QueA [Candidatus Aerophobetes bacterium]
MKLKDFYYQLPGELIAQYPAPQRDESRLLVLHRERGEIEHKRFYEILHYFQEGDVLVLNNTYVIPARLKGKKEATGGKAEVLLLKKKEEDIWECLLKPARRIREGSSIFFPETELKAYILKKSDGAKAIVKFTPPGKLAKLIAKIGQVPLPPYIKRKEGPGSRDRERYQTVYAKEEGAIAAPTAGLHFTSSLLQKIKDKGVKIAEVTLHTGWASFKPLNEEIVEENQIPEEFYKIEAEAAEIIRRARRVVTVGTSATRALETEAKSTGLIEEGEGWTNLFIYPGYTFKIVDSLITNFHMPGTSLILLVSAFIGREKLLTAYKEAIKEKYRFLSFGDAMLII